MITENLVNLFDRELQKLKNEINAYNNAEKIWVIDNLIKNSGGNLCLHLLGNLQHYIGAILGGSGYVRNRPLEFSSRNVAITEINNLIDTTRKVVSSTLTVLTSEDLAREYPEKVFEFATSTEFHLLHLLTHLSYHLGQINYHRRMLDTEIN
jgi:uncharacterized damage-inducible protein DinB